MPHNGTPEQVAAWDQMKEESVRHLLMDMDSVFYASVMANCTYVWDQSVPTAEVRGLTIHTNPEWFGSLPVKTRATVLYHEIKHVGHLHELRIGDRDREDFNAAADHVINLELKDAGFDFTGTEPLCDETYRGHSVEEVYDLIVSRKPPPPPPPPSGSGSCSGEGPTQEGLGTRDWGNGNDLKPPDPSEGTGNPSQQEMADALQEQMQQMIQVIEQALETDKMVSNGKNPGSYHGELASFLKQIREPKVDWATVLHEYMQEKTKHDINYRKPNRRYEDVFIPARESYSELIHVAFFDDASGSVSDSMLEQSHSEIFTIKADYQPKLLTYGLFDTRLWSVTTYERDEDFVVNEIPRRGGTSLVPVANWLKQNRPTVAVIFSDLECAPMEVIDGVDIIWICVNNPKAQVNQGTLIHITVHDDRKRF